MGCVSQVGEQALQRRPRRLADRRLARVGAATTIDRQCGSSKQAGRSPPRQPPVGPPDLVVAGGYRIMSRVPMGSNLGEAGWSGFSEKLLRPVADRPAGHLGGGDRGGVGRSPRVARRVLLRLAHARPRAGDRRGPLRAGDRPGRGLPTRIQESSSRSTRRRGAIPRSRRWQRCPPAFKEDGVVTAGKLQRDRRRRSSRCWSRARSQCVCPRAGAARAVRFLRDRRRRPVPDAPRQPTGVRPGADQRWAVLWDDMAVIEVNEAFASVVLQFVQDNRARRQDGAT